jgi:hypothetical protein
MRGYHAGDERGHMTLSLGDPGAQIGDDVIGFVERLAVDNEAGDLLLAAYPDKIVLVAWLERVTGIKVDAVLSHETQDFLAIGTGFLVIKAKVLKIWHGCSFFHEA